MKWKVAMWSGLIMTLLSGCSSRQEVVLDREPITIPLEQLSRYWVQEKKWSWFGNDDPVLPTKPVKGYVEVRYQIDASGMPVKPEVVAAEPPGELEQSALATLSRIRYSPAKGNPDAIPVEVINRFDIEIN
ncbi:energy transducer TonB [Aeromonas australiensis]|uniref:energy transducer TonB n=1 Tax=Aeromonas australiensis TaxID=1114880 RepID=UPI000589FC82|nr:energy transducer TonB [Aeromonas australiensis]